MRRKKLVAALLLMWAVLAHAEGETKRAATFDRHGDALEFRHAGGGLKVSLQSPTFTFADGAEVAPASPESVSGAVGAEGGMKAAYAPMELGGGGTLEVTMHLAWSPAEQVLRKYARYRLSAEAKPRVLADVTLDAFEAPQARLTGGAIQSYPAFFDGFFAGVEFPVATTHMEDGKVIVSHRPGLRMQPNVWYEGRKAVYGAAVPGREEEAFSVYITGHRPQPQGLHVNYNSWWTSPVPFSEDDILGLMGILDEKLFKSHGVSLDTFAIDLGWSKPQSIWAIDPDRFPDEFTNIQGRAEAMGAELGLWISPSSFYPQGLDTDWAAEEGFETLRIDWFGRTARLCCLGGPKYAGQIGTRLADMIGRFGIRHVKLDGCWLQCNQADHGHEPDLLASEAVAEGAIGAFQAARDAAPDVWLEATCFGWNPSPWWVFHVNSVIGTFGDDAPHGRVPAPVYWESATTARDYFNLQGAGLLPIPDAAQEVLGIIVQTDDPFLNDGVVVVLRGHMFLPLYVDPQHMNDARWGRLAGLIEWARANEDVLGHATEPLLPVSWQGGKVPRFTNDDAMPREAYGYAHWKDGRGLVLLRNPWMEPTTYALPLPEGAGEVDIVSLYPEPRDYARGVLGTVEIPMAPCETLVLAVAPRQPRAPTACAEAVNTGLHVEVTETHTIRYTVKHDGELLGPDWTAVAPEGMTADVMLKAHVAARTPQAQLLVLLEGTETPHPSHAVVRANGKEVPVEIASSDAGWSASSIPAGPEKWLFLRAALPVGESEIELELRANGGVTHVAAWVWGTKQGETASGYANALPQPETISLASAVLLPHTSVERFEKVGDRPAVVKRIDGVFLDALEPVFAEQGWGTLQKNQSVLEGSMSIGGVPCLRGLGTHAASRIVYDTAGAYATFEASVGMNGAATGTLVFAVKGDGETLWESGIVRGGEAPVAVRVDVSGVKELELIVGDAGDGITADHANWADAKLLR